MNKLGKGPPGYAVYQFQASEPCSSGEEDFKYISFLNTRPPPQGHFGPQGHHLNKLGRRPLGNATKLIIKALGLSVSEKMSVEAIVDDARFTIDDGHWLMAIAHPELMIDESKNVQTTPTRIHCKRSRPLPYSNPNIGRPGTGSLPSTIAPPDHPTILCEHLMFNEGIKSREIKSDCYIARFQWGFCLFVDFTKKNLLFN